MTDQRADAPRLLPMVVAELRALNAALHTAAAMAGRSGLSFVVAVKSTDAGARYMEKSGDGCLCPACIAEMCLSLADIPAELQAKARAAGAPLAAPPGAVRH